MEAGKFRTVVKTSEGFYKEKGSKFLAFAIPVNSEAAVKKHIDNLRKEHYQAVHVCSAFRLGRKMDVFRASDDGEPNNSAGMPILGQILSFEVTNVLVAVVRYYGGTKLGVGGLINAYRTAAKDALDNATIVVQEEFRWQRVLFNYAQMPEVMAWVKKHDLITDNQAFELECSIDVGLPLQSTVTEELARFELEIIELGIY